MLRSADAASVLLSCQNILLVLILSLVGVPANQLLSLVGVLANQHNIMIVDFEKRHYLHVL
jgi:hypothetical protein